MEYQINSSFNYTYINILVIPNPDNSSLVHHIPFFNPNYYQSFLEMFLIRVPAFFTYLTKDIAMKYFLFDNLLIRLLRCYIEFLGTLKFCEKVTEKLQM